MAEPTKPLVIVRPAPQSIERIFTAEVLEELRAAYEVHILDEEPGVEERFDALLPRAFAVVGQPDLPTERLARATELRALLNVEGNFFPNVDYAAAFARGIHVLACGPAYATAVAEYALGLALDLARGISPGGPGLPRRAGTLRLGLDRRLDPAHRRDGRAGRLRQPGPGAAPAAAAVPTHAAGLRPVAARPGDRRVRRDGDPAGRPARDERVRLRAGHGDAGERAPARCGRAGPPADRARG